MVLSRAWYRRIRLGSDGVRVCDPGGASSYIHTVLVLATAAASLGLRCCILSCVHVVLVLVTAAVPVVLR